jgi:nicotinamidase-related amidase
MVEVTGAVVLPAQTWSAPQDSRSDWPARVEVALELEWSRSALVLIDVWDTHPNAAFRAELEAAMPALRSVLKAYRAHDRPVFHDATGLAIHPSVLEGWGSSDQLIAWDPMGGGTSVLDRHLREARITTIVWAGFSTNLCLMSKPCGFRKMLTTDWSRTHVLVRDATAAFEAADTAATRSLWDAACYEVEYYPNGYSVLAADLLAALPQKNAA